MSDKPPKDYGTERGALADMSPATQAARARRAKSPWRNGPSATTKKARESFDNFMSKEKGK